MGHTNSPGWELDWIKRGKAGVAETAVRMPAANLTDSLNPLPRTLVLGKNWVPQVVL